MDDATRHDARHTKPHQIADVLREQIVSGELSDGESIGKEPGLVERFGVSRPSMREALRILETEGLITIRQGPRGGVVVNVPDERMTARTAAILLRARNVPLADVFEMRTILEPLAAKAVARSRRRQSAVAELRQLIAEERVVLDEHDQFGIANARFHARLVSLAGNETMSIVAEMVNEVVSRAVAAVSDAGDAEGSGLARRRGLRSQERLLEHLSRGDGDGAEAHWRAHMQIIGRVMLGQQASTVVDLMDGSERRRSTPP